MPNGVKGYKLWCLELSFTKCFISCDVAFKEEEMTILVKTNQVVEIQEPKQSQLEVEFLGGVTNSREVPIQNEREPTAKSKSESLTNYMLAKDREKKQAKPTQRYGFAELIAFALNLAKDIEQHEPLTYVGAMKSSQKREWMQAMVEEIQSLESNQTWELVDRPRNNWVVACKWIFKKKGY